MCLNQDKCTECIVCLWWGMGEGCWTIYKTTLFEHMFGNLHNHPNKTYQTLIRPAMEHPTAIWRPNNKTSKGISNGSTLCRPFWPASLVQWLAASLSSPWWSGFNPRVQSPGSAYRQFGSMPKMEIHTCYNSQKVTAASV